MKKTIFVTYLIICLILLAGCGNNSNSEETSKEKIIAELEYCSSRLVDLLNSLNNISLENYELISQKVRISQETEEASGTGGELQGNNSQSSGQQSGQQQSGGENQEVTVTEMQTRSILNTDTENIDWDLLRSEIEVINSYWSVIMLDLYNEKVSNEDIMNFSNILDQCTVSINAEDKNNAISSIATLYSYIPRFLNSVSADESLQNITNTQNYIIMAYVAANAEEWDVVNTNMANAENTFISVLNNIEYTKNKEYKVNKSYMAIKDMQNAVKIQDKPLILLKYKNLMESLNTL